jgi:serine protease Do
MIVMKWTAIAGVALLTLAGAPAGRAGAQEREPLLRALDVAGRGVQIGASVADIDAKDAKQPKAGVVVGSVTPGGPAEKAGIKSGDVITEFDGERVRSVRQFSRLVQETTPDRDVAIVLSRGGQRVNATVTPERRAPAGELDSLLDLPRITRPGRIPTPPTPPSAPRPARPPAFLVPDMRLDQFDAPGLLRLWNTHGIGVTIESIDDQLAQYFGVKEGVLVKSVVDESPAQKAGVKAGDVITAFNGSKVYDASDLTRAIDRLEADADFTVDVMRDRKPQSLKGKFDGQARRRTRTMF